MLSSELYKIMVTKGTLVGFMGGDRQNRLTLDPPLVHTEGILTLTCIIHMLLWHTVSKRLPTPEGSRSELGLSTIEFIPSPY